MTVTDKVSVCSHKGAESAPRSGELSTLRRGLEILKLLQQAAHTGGGPLGNNRIADALGADKSQVSRALRILVDSGLVSRDVDSRGYRLGPAAYSLGMRAADQELIRNGAAVVREVVRVTGYRGYLVIRDADQAITLWSEQPSTMPVAVNSMGMAYSVTESETGRALLFGTAEGEIRAILKGHPADVVDEVITRVGNDRREGFAWRGGGVIEGGVAVPVWATGRKVVAVIGVASSALSERAEIFPAVRVLTKAAADLTERITRKDRQAVKAVPYFGWPQSPQSIFEIDR